MELLLRTTLGTVRISPDMVGRGRQLLVEDLEGGAVNHPDARDVESNGASAAGCRGPRRDDLVLAPLGR